MSTLGIAYIFMHLFIEAFDSNYVKESYIDHDVIIPKTCFVRYQLEGGRQVSKSSNLPLMPSIRQS